LQRKKSVRIVRRWFAGFSQAIVQDLTLGLGKLSDRSPEDHLNMTLRIEKSPKLEEPPSDIVG